VFNKRKKGITELFPSIVKSVYAHVHRYPGLIEFIKMDITGVYISCCYDDIRSLV